MRSLSLLLTLLSTHSILAQPEFIQIPFQQEQNSPSSLNQFNPFHHFSALSPWFDANAETSNELQSKNDCSVVAAIFLIRHSTLTANDEDWESMQPFLIKLQAELPITKTPSLKSSKLDFLRDWQQIIHSTEQVTLTGKQDSVKLGRRIRKQYPHLFKPSTTLNRAGTQESIKVWSASSNRDLITAKNFIDGSFTKQEDLQLINVPNTIPAWSQSLTPHKVCPAFEKESSLHKAAQFLSTFAPAIIDRFIPVFLDYGFSSAFVNSLTNEDILGISMLCGSESAILSGHDPLRKLGEMDKISGFCGLFEEEDFIHFENYHDIRYHYMVGYGSNLSPYLGFPFLNNVAHLLKSDGNKKGDKHLETYDQNSALPGPNATHTQAIHFFFTHRESPPTLAVILGLFNSSTISGDWPKDPNASRLWRSSQIFPFLGHITFEKLSCSTTLSKSKAAEIFIRIRVNDKIYPIPRCMELELAAKSRSKSSHRPEEGLCSIKHFEQFVKERRKDYGDFEGACSL